MSFASVPDRAGLAKCPTGVLGFDQITEGGLPQGRPTLICGGAGCGKSLFAATFLVNGAILYDEPGVFVSFEETEDDIAKNVASLGFDLPALVAAGKLALDHVRVERGEIEEAGDYDLEGLFLRLGHAIQTIGAKRVVLDTIETLFGGFTNMAVLRGELRRLFRWLKDQGVTAIVTGEHGERMLTRHGLEEYVSDCVVVLEHRVVAQVATRRLRVLKYRGSVHGTNEYPFLIDEHGMSVLPVTSLRLDHEVSVERVTAGIPGLDGMLGGLGFFRGSSVLVSGTSGSGKSTLAAHLVHSACGRGERCAYFAFEESPGQIVRNMRSVGIDLQPWRDAGTLRFVAARPTLWGLESHLARMYDIIERFRPSIVVVDPIYTLAAVGTSSEVHSMLLRFVDLLKSRGVTGLFVSLESGNIDVELASISSLMDTWIQLRLLEENGVRNRSLFVLKSRGMAHSNAVRPFTLGPGGIQLGEEHAMAEGS
ncbi:MAG: circadian clock protein KaiC [Alphaproteobacteria bacterium]|nr:circadian clock protein KaiC [Alphaproteobacteria bacterium]